MQHSNISFRAIFFFCTFTFDTLDFPDNIYLQHTGVLNAWPLLALLLQHWKYTRNLPLLNNNTLYFNLNIYTKQEFPPTAQAETMDVLWWPLNTENRTTHNSKQAPRIPVTWRGVTCSCAFFALPKHRVQSFPEVRAASHWRYCRHLPVFHPFRLHLTAATLQRIYQP